MDLTCERCGHVGVDDDEVDPVFGRCASILDCNDRRGYVSDHAFRTGAAVAFGLMGMAAAIGAR